jgi:hypothetical protein
MSTGRAVRLPFASPALLGTAVLRRQVLGPLSVLWICLLLSNQNSDLAVDRSDTLERQEARL